MYQRFKKLLTAAILFMIVACLCLFFLMMLNEYTISHYKVKRAYSEKMSAEYQMNAELMRMQNIAVKLQISEVQLQKFLKQYGDKEK